MPFRKTVIVVLIALGVLGYAGSTHFEDEEYGFSVEDLRTVRIDPSFTVPPQLLQPRQDPPYAPGVNPAGSQAPVVPPMIEVSLDPVGRPYDQPLPRGAKVERRPLAVIHAPSGKVLFTGGEETLNLGPGLHRPIQLADRPGNRYRVDAIWLDDGADERIVGVALVERDSRVVRWRESAATAYSTHAGLGAITTVEWSLRRKGVEHPVYRLYWDRLFGTKRQAGTADADGHEGVDTVIFRNGVGDGSFPSFAGYDASGRRAQVVLWPRSMPWRAGFPTGTPPVAVARRENQLRSCLEGRVLDGFRCRIAR